ncbi:MAG: hypothetical protein CMB80_07695 [Flammeovirgaceae bacterium]|nr:hypothetical protein [Flammeovirgaceae bacterium]HCX20712.1 hypothetical protein [Cytophagales bacterium]|tara:strand:- start:157 stop:546 length:390 start_codon:yes stop_codon:yes gene_type:complete
MKSLKAVLIGVFIWFLGASFYTASYLFPFLKNVELQANLTLAIALIPNAWLGARLYYRWQPNAHGLQLGLVVLLTAILLDALITVPFFILPAGGSYLSFFGTASFWLIAIEYLLVVYGYWRIKVQPKES